MAFFNKSYVLKRVIIHVMPGKQCESFNMKENIVKRVLGHPII